MQKIIIFPLFLSTIIIINLISKNKLVLRFFSKNKLSALAKNNYLKRGVRQSLCVRGS